MPRGITAAQGIALRNARHARRRAAARRSRLPKRMAKAVKRVVLKAQETKYVSTRYDTLHNSSISAADATAICPAIAQGTDDFQRIGDKVRGTYLILKGKVQYDTAYLESNGTTFIPPVTLRMLILSQKNIRSNDQIANWSYAALLKDNVGVGVGRQYQGGPWDNLAPINKDLFKVHMDKKIKLNWVHPVNVTTTVDQGATGNDRTRYFTCKIPVKKNLYFDSSVGGFPDNFAPFFVMGGVCDDGSAPYSTGTPYRVSWLSTLYFKDA